MASKKNLKSRVESLELELERERERNENTSSEGDRESRRTYILGVVSVVLLFLGPISVAVVTESLRNDPQPEPLNCSKVRSDAKKLYIEDKYVWSDVASQAPEQTQCLVNDYIDTIPIPTPFRTERS